MPASVDSGAALCAVALGSNIDPETHLVAAVRRLARAVRLTAASRVYRTPPWGYADQPDFLNAVVLGRTALAPLGLLDALQGIERRLQRQRPFPNAPRTIDLDLLFYDEVVMDAPRLTLPHPRMHERPFVLVPLADVAPGWRHPGLQRTVAELLGRVGAAGVQPHPLRLPV